MALTKTTEQKDEGTSGQHNGLVANQGSLPVVMGGQRSCDCRRYV